MSLPMRHAAKALLLFVVLDVAGAQAQQPAVAEPQAPSGTVQTPPEVVPALPVPRLVKFAGTLKDKQGQPRTGVGGVTFAVYKDQEGGAALWVETQNVQLDEQGRYTVLLGATKSEGLPLELFSAGEPRWLGVQVNLPREVEQPRVLLVSVPYALKAADADTLAGKPLSAFLLAESGTPATRSIATAGAPAGSGPAPAAATCTTPPCTVVTPGGTTGFLSNFSDATTIQNSPIFASNGQVGVGTTNPQASLDVQLTTGAATNALNSTITLNNSTPITGSVLSAFKMTLLDQSTATNLSKQPARFVYLRDAAATGGVTAFDSVMTATSFLNADAPYLLRGVNIEGPTLATGKTLSNFTGLYIGSPSGPGTVSNKFALVTEANAGNVGIGTTAPTAPLEVAGNLKVSGAGNAIIFPNGTVMSSAATGVGGGTITGVTAGAGLTGGGTAGGVTLSVPNGGITNSMLAANSVTNANVADGSLNATKIVGTAATLGANSFTGNQTIAANVGIGTTTPAAQLDVVGNNSTAILKVTQNGTGPAATFSGAANHLFDIIGTGGQAQINMVGPQTILTLNSTIAPPNAFANVTFSHSGIGKWVITTNPGFANENQLGIVDASGTSRLTLDPTGNATITGNLKVIDAGKTGLRVQTNTTGGTVASFGGNGDFQIDAPGILGGRFIVKDNGPGGAIQVGIGTPTPSTALEVAGNIKVNTAGNGLIFPDGTKQSTAAIGGGATLGANTFTGTQTISSGNLALPQTTNANNGVVTMGGTTFLHSCCASVSQSGPFVGFSAGNMNVTGKQNAAFGYAALSAVTSGCCNVAFGANALLNNNIGSGNSAFGVDALSSNTGFGANSAFGYTALTSNTGFGNSAFGNGAMFNNTTGGNNSAFGLDALLNVTTGSNNIAVGLNAGINFTGAESNNINIGNPGVVGESNNIRIGSGGTHLAVFFAGVRGVTTGNADAIPVVIDSGGQLGTASSSRRVKQDIRDMGDTTDIIMRLHPVRFRYKVHGPDGPEQYGLVAEEVAEVASDLAVRNRDGEIETVFYDKVNAMLLNEVQKQHRQIESQERRMRAQQEQLQAQAVQLAELKAQLEELAAKQRLPNRSSNPVH